MTALMTLLVGGVTSSFWTLEAAFDDQVAESDLQLKSRAAMDRLVHLTGMAITSDPQLAFLGTKQRAGKARRITAARKVTTQDTTVNTSPTLQFREIKAIVNGNPVFEDDLKYILMGAQTSPESRGVLLGRGPSASAIAQYGAGPDAILGTADDPAIEFVAGTPAVQTLLSEDYSPRVGTMLEFTTEVGSDGRLITIILRTNVRRPDGSYLLDTDLVLQERVALKW